MFMDVQEGKKMIHQSPNWDQVDLLGVGFSR